MAVAIVAWPFRSVEPEVGGDWSWVAALSYAAQHGLDYGGEIVWSYGPLGFLDTWYGPVLFYGDILALSWLYALVVQLLLAATLLYALRRSLPLALAAVVAAVVLVLAPERTTALGLAWCVLVLTRDQDAPRDLAARAFPLALGVLTGIAVLGKLNQGAELVVLAIVTLVAVPRRRDALAFAGTLLATAAAGWLLTGQSLGDVWPYVRNAAEVVAGYAAAMGTSEPSYRWTYPAALAIVVLALGLTWDVARGAPSRRRWGLLAVAAVYVAFNFKEAFVRQDPGHLEVLFGELLVLFAVLPVRASWRPVALGSIVAGVVALGVIVGSHDLARTLNPVANVTAAADQLRTLASPGRRDALTAEVRAKYRSIYALSPETVERLRGRTAMFWPYLFGEAAWAYDLDLRPLPVIEPYGVYTQKLDRLAAEMIASSRAPERIVHLGNQGGGVIDGRYPSFEAPLATLEILCRYREVAVQDRWQVLARSGDRCGAPRTIGAVDVPWGGSVAVPDANRPDALVLARVEGADPHGLEQVRSLLLRPKPRWIELDGMRFRLVAATAADGLLLRAPRNADYGGAFAMAPSPLRVAIGRDGGQPGGELRYTFVEVPIRPLAAAGDASAR